MANWPDIQNPSMPFEETVYKPQVKSESEGNYVHTRPRTSRARGRWPLRWPAMTEADYQTLLAFFTANQGSSFTWTHPKSLVSYTCVFSTDNLTSKIIAHNRREVAVNIEEL